MSPVFSGAKFHGPALSIITQFYFSVSGEEDRSSTDQQIMQWWNCKSDPVTIYFSHFQLLFQTVSSPVDSPKNVDCHLSLSLGYWCLSWQCFAPREIDSGMIDLYGFHTRGCPSRNLAW